MKYLVNFMVVPLTKNGSVAGRPRGTTLNRDYKTSRASPVNCSRWLGDTAFCLASCPFYC